MKNKPVNEKPTKTKIFTKRFTIILFVIFLLSMTLASVLKQKIESRYEQEELDSFTAQRWDSDAALVDDRLPKDYPVMFIIAPVIIEDIQSANAMVVYNDGSYLSELFTYESYDSFQEQLSSRTAFWQQIKDGYSDFTGSDWSHISSTDEEPADIRDIYLSQYDIEDFSLNKTVNMLDDGNTFFLFGITYDDNKEPDVHMYYAQSRGETNIPASEKTQKVLTDMTELLIQNDESEG